MGPGCILDSPELTGISASGNILLGAVLPLHLGKEHPKVSYTDKPSPVICKKLSLETFLQVHVVIYAINEINRNSDILPNITLGFQIFDSCSVLQREMEGTLWMMTGQSRAIPNFQCQKKKMAAIIGHSSSTYSILMAHILGLSRYPQISHFSTSSILSDKTQFPSFLRTVPSDYFQSKGLAQLVLHFGWTWIGLVALDNDYGQQGIQVLKKEILKSGACVEFTEYILVSQPNNNVPRIVQAIKESTAQAVIVFSTDVPFLPLLEELLKHNVTGKTWVASEGWSTSSLFSLGKYDSLLSGTIGFAYYSGNIPGFTEYLDHVDPHGLPEWAWNLMFWEESVGCAFANFGNFTFPRQRPSRNCTEKETVEPFQTYAKQICSMRIAYNLHTAVFVIAKALHDLSMCKSLNNHITNGSCVEIQEVEPWQILNYIKKVQMRLSSDREMLFDINGDPPPVHDIVNWQQSPEGLMKQVTVGFYDSSTLAINISAMKWATGSQKIPVSVCSESCLPGYRKAHIPRKPNCCFQCVPCPAGEITNTTDTHECMKCPWDQWPSQQRDKCVPKLTEYLSYEETLGVILMSTSITSSLVPLVVLGLLIHHKTTPIVRANNYSISCLLLVSMSLCFLCTLTFIGLPNQEKCLLRQVTFGMVFALCVSCILAKTLMVLVAFRATRPNSNLKKWAGPQMSFMVIIVATFVQLSISVIWLAMASPFPEYNLKAKSGIIIVECNEGSPTAFWCTTGYLGLLAFVSFIVAYLTRELPGSFNESKYITFSMLAFLSVWVSYIPASLSTSGKYMVAMEIFAILSSSWAMLCCMFGPKCYTILFQPNMNSKKHLLRKIEE